jgi:ribosome-associated protein
MQFIGRLMRDVDPLPIQARLEQWEGAPNAEKARLTHVERWRTRLLSEADALDRLCVENPRADRPRLEALVTRVRDERAHGQPPHAYRELFRALNALLAAT